MFVACIGSRDITPEEETLMEDIGAYLARNGHTVKTGNAKGADQAYARGANRVSPAAVVLCLPWANYEEQAVKLGNIIHHESQATAEERAYAELAHPAWLRLTQGARKLMVRNAMIIFGSTLVIARTNPAKKGGGGTGHGVRIAEMLGIKVRDLSDYQQRREIEQKLRGGLV